MFYQQAINSLLAKRKLTFLLTAREFLGIQIVVQKLSIEANSLLKAEVKIQRREKTGLPVITVGPMQQYKWWSTCHMYTYLTY